MRKEKLFVVFEVLADSEHEGPAADGTVIYRFHKQANAEAFAAKNTCYGRPARANRDEVPRRLADRWSFED